MTRGYVVIDQALGAETASLFRERLLTEHSSTLEPGRVRGQTTGVAVRKDLRSDVHKFLGRQFDIVSTVFDQEQLAK